MKLTFLSGYLLAINILAFILMGKDKLAAIQRRRRIPEKVLLLLAVVGGALGELMGMLSYRHKTKHLKFTLVVPALLFLQLLALGWWVLAR